MLLHARSSKKDVVNHRALQMVVECVKAHGWDQDWFFHGLDYSEDNIPEWISWSDWIGFMNRAGEKAGSDDALRKMGMDLFKVPAASYLLRLVGLFSDLGSMLIKMNHLIMRSFFPCLVFDTEVSENKDRCVVHLTIPDHLEGCRSFLVMSASAYESIFLSLKVPFGNLKYECTEYEATYSFEYRSKPTIASRLRQTVRILVGADFAVNQIAAHEEELLRRLELTEAARAEAEELREKEKAARKIAEESLQVRRRFLAIMSHELRTPLNHIIGSVGILEIDALNEEQAEFVEIIKQSSTDLLELIELVLTFTSTGSFSDDRPQAHTLKDILGSLIDDFRTECQLKALGFKVPNIDTFPSMVVQGAHLRQILKLLLENAIKFTHQGFVELDIETHDDNLLQIRVADTGIGIPADRQAEIFAAFYTVDSSVTRTAHGVGLGLTIARKLAIQIGGHLILQKSTTEGSVFELSVPINSDFQVPLVEQTIPQQLR